MIKLKTVAGKLFEILYQNDDINMATKYFSEKSVMRATRRRYRRSNEMPDTLEIIFTYGRPNFREREFIKKCKKAGEPFPIKKIQLRYEKV